MHRAEADLRLDWCEPTRGRLSVPKCPARVQSKTYRLHPTVKPGVEKSKPGEERTVVGELRKKPRTEALCPQLSSVAKADLHQGQETLEVQW
jgi:hypothetical protein